MSRRRARRREWPTSCLNARGLSAASCWTARPAVPRSGGEKKSRAWIRCNSRCSRAATRVGLQVIEQGNDTSTAEGRAMFGMLSVLAELQRELIVANTRDGLAAARARAGSAVASPSSPRSRRRSPSSSTTPEARPSPRSPPCSVSPGPPSTATSPSTRSTPRRAVRRRHRSPLTRRGGRRHGRLPRRPRPLQDPERLRPEPASAAWTTPKRPARPIADPFTVPGQ